MKMVSISLAVGMKGVGKDCVEISRQTDRYLTTALPPSCPSTQHPHVAHQPVISPCNTNLFPTSNTLLQHPPNWITSTCNDTKLKHPLTHLYGCSPSQQETTQRLTSSGWRRHRRRGSVALKPRHHFPRPALDGRPTRTQRSVGRRCQPGLGPQWLVRTDPRPCHRGPLLVGTRCCMGHMVLPSAFRHSCMLLCTGPPLGTDIQSTYAWAGIHAFP